MGDLSSGKIPSWPSGVERLDSVPAEGGGGWIENPGAPSDNLMGLTYFPLQGTW